MLRVFVVVTLLCACGAAQRDTTAAEDAGPTPLTAPEAADLASSLLGVLSEMAAIVEAQATDCPAMARELDALFDRAQPLFDAANGARADDLSARRLTRAMEERSNDVPGLVGRITPRLEACKDEPAVQAAVARMPVL